MSLYDDDDLGTKPPVWSSGIKLMPTVKRPQPPITKKVSTVRIKQNRNRYYDTFFSILFLVFMQVLTPVINLTTNKKEDLKSLIKPKVVISNKPIIPVPALPTLQSAVKDYSWEIEDEYDPSFPNDYDKIMKERREKIEENRRRDRERKRKGSPNQNKNFIKATSDDEDEYNKYAKLGAAGQKAAIAPPPSLQENTPSDSSYGASGSVAEKIMAKYGWQGQGLGKQEQGMAIALQVEKTSKRGGRIIHEKELKEKELMPPPILGGPATPSTAIPGSVTPLQGTAEQREQSITEIIKSPSKVVLLRVRNNSYLDIKNYFFYVLFNLAP